MVTVASNDIKSEPLSSKISIESSRRQTASTARRLTTDKLRELDVIGSLHENDILKICVKTLQKSQIAQVLTLQAMKSEDGITDLQTELLLDLCYKTFYRAWGSYTKYLRSQVIDKGNAVHCTLFGTFSQVGNLSEKKDNVSVKLITFLPTTDLLSQFGFKHDSERLYNLAAQNYKEIKYRHVFVDEKLHRVNYNAIAQAAQITETQLMFILKQILLAIETAMRKDYFVKLNIKVGFLKFKQNNLFFENLVSDEELDKMTHTSCNTEFRNNKWLMTNIKTQRAATNIQGGEDGTSQKSTTLKDALSRIATPQTPQTKSFRSVFSNADRSTQKPTIGDPNQLSQRFSERKARRLNTLVDQNYGKRMHIAGRDKHQDFIANKQLQEEIIVQQIAKEELRNLDRLAEKEEALDIISQIKDSLELATQRKQNLLYKQKNVVQSALQQQIEERQRRKLQEREEQRKVSDFFPFKSDEEFAQKQAAIRRQRNEDMRERLNRSVKAQQEYEEKRRLESEKQQIEDTRVKVTPSKQAIVAFETGKNVMQEALRRYEQKMQKQNEERLKELSDIKRDIEKIQIETSSNVFLQKQKSKMLGKTLEQQLEDKRNQKEAEKVENKAFIKPHFGPEDPDPHVIYELAKKRAADVAEVINKQIKDNNERRDLNKKVQLLEEVRAAKINELVVQHEDEIASEHEKLKKQVLREAWEEQQRMRHEKDVNDYKYYKLLQ